MFFIILQWLVDKNEREYYTKRKRRKANVSAVSFYLSIYIYISFACKESHARNKHQNTVFSKHIEQENGKFTSVRNAVIIMTPQLKTKRRQYKERKKKIIAHRLEKLRTRVSFKKCILLSINFFLLHPSK